MTIYKDVTGLDEKRPHVDHLIRHKWPEETPEKDGQYLIRIISPIGSVYYRLQGYEDWHNFGNYITHWWNLPEVREDSHGNTEPNVSGLLKEIEEQRKIIERQKFVLDVIKKWAYSEQKASVGYTKARRAIQALLKGRL